MILAVCLDNGNGLSFLGRRQSRDREVSSHILSRLGENTLWLNPGSAELFPSDDPRIAVADAVPEARTGADVLFWEHGMTVTELRRFSQIWIYRWNRDYPRDTRFPVDALESRYSLAERTEFSGYSHEKITLEVYQLA